MNSTAKVLVPNKEWLVTDNQEKIGSISKVKKGYVFLHKGQEVSGFANLNEVKNKFGIAVFEESFNRVKREDDKNPVIYDFPCSSKPYNPVYSVKKKLPLYAKSSKSKSQYCAGYYVIKFRKGWLKSFCPKLITLERYPYHGPFKTESEMKSELNLLNKP
jgi:hypothetical protein